jgi:hypothetical protein
MRVYNSIAILIAALCLPGYGTECSPTVNNICVIEDTKSTELITADEETCDESTAIDDDDWGNEEWDPPYDYIEPTEGVVTDYTPVLPPWLTPGHETYTYPDSNTNSGELNVYTVESTDTICVQELCKSRWLKTKTIHIDSVDEIKSVKVDGKTAKVKDTDTPVSVKLSDGSHKVTVKTVNAKKTFTVKVDSTKPTVSGVKNGKTYSKAVTIKFSDETSGIKKATLNGKTIKTGKKVTKAGSYTLKVTDKAGNTRTIKFKIKK